MSEQTWQEAGADWLEGQMKKLSSFKPTGFWWKGKVYYPGDRLPRSLKKCLNKLIVVDEATSENV
jgi:hypothetical protein